MCIPVGLQDFFYPTINQNLPRDSILDHAHPWIVCSWTHLRYYNYLLASLIATLYLNKKWNNSFIFHSNTIFIYRSAWTQGTKICNELAWNVSAGNKICQKVITQYWKYVLKCWCLPHSLDHDRCFAYLIDLQVMACSNLSGGNVWFIIK